MIGKKVLNYSIESLIGKGGMGNVFLGVHDQLGRKVAIKMLHTTLSQNQNLKDRFKLEASTLAHLQHPNIVGLFDYVEDDNGLFLIMEYVDGMGLDEYINNVSGPIEEATAIKLFTQILDGFQYAHANKIVHRDIKPSNILICDDKTIKIMDFGIAKILDDDKSMTKTGTQMGTVLYMSPEQVKGEKIDHLSDIYSLGVTLFQMVTGKCPYDQNTTEFLVYNQIVGEPLPKASTFYPAVSAHLEATIAKATSKNNKDRFQDCAEFKTFLKDKSTTKIVSQENKENEKKPIIAPVAPKSSIPPVSKKESKKSKKVLIFLMLLILIGGSIGGYIVFNNSNNISSTIEEVPFELKYVMIGHLNIYDEPGEDNKVLYELDFGDEIKILSGEEKQVDEKAFQKVLYQGKEGWVLSRVKTVDLLTSKENVDKLQTIIIGDYASEALEEMPAYSKYAILDFIESQKFGDFKIIANSDFLPIVFYRSREGNRNSSDDQKKEINDGLKDMVFIASYDNFPQSLIYTEFTNEYQPINSKKCLDFTYETEVIGLDRLNRRSKFYGEGFYSYEYFEGSLDYDAIYGYTSDGYNFALIRTGKYSLEGFWEYVEVSY